MGHCGLVSAVLGNFFWGGGWGSQFLAIFEIFGPFWAGLFLLLVLGNLKPPWPLLCRDFFAVWTNWVCFGPVWAHFRNVGLICAF